MKEKLLFFLISLFLSLGIFAQNGRIGEHDLIESWESVAAPELSTPADARKLAREIISITGLNSNFEVRAANVPNAAAVVYDGKRYILYNPNFMKKLDHMTGTRWASISVIAHEIGHHLKGHKLGSSGYPLGGELDADQFSGYVLRKMGASLEEAQAAMKTIADARATRTHPAKYDRLNSIANGWAQAHEQLRANTSDVASNSTSRSERWRLPADKTESNSTLTIADKNFIGDIRFHADPDTRFYVTTKYNVVKVEGRNLQVIGKLEKLNHRQFPYLIHDGADTQLFVSESGVIYNKKGKQVGSLRAHQS